MEDQKEGKYKLRDFVSNVRDNGIAKALGRDLVETFKLYKPASNENEETVRQSVGTGALAISTVGVLMGIVASPFYFNNIIEAKKKDGQRPLLWEQFDGNHNGYDVEISESFDKNGNKRRIMHLDAIEENTNPHRITGHDNQMDGHFDRLFIMEGPSSPADSVYFTNDGVIWGPSGASEMKGKAPFTQEQIVDAQKELYGALSTVRTEDNKTRHWTPDMGMKSGLIKKD